MLPVIAAAPPMPKLPVVITSCDPKSGEILVPAIAALAFISTLTIVPLSILAEVTEPLIISLVPTELLANLF